MNRSASQLVLTGLLLAPLVGLHAANLQLPVAPGPFEPTDESLEQYQCPEWFRDAKLGIWSHWGPVAAPGGFGGNWYARQMYVQGSRENLHHVATRGHPSKSGYKDVIELWKAEKFDPDRLMDLYVKAGAKYFVSMGAHHDNFDLWNSKHQEWNAVNHGPKKDIVGLWRDAARKRGLRFGVSEHFARSYNWMQRSHGSDTNGPFAGVPYDGADPKYARLYGPPHGDTSAGYPTNPPPTWTREWFDRMQDLVHSYQPDLVYSDGGIPFGAVGRSFMADFYNTNLEANGGRLEAVYTIKKGRSVGDFVEGVAIQDEENSVLAGIKEQPWQTDASIGTWFFVPDLEPKWRRSGPDVIVMLADIVAKNGNLLLNIPQRGDGTIDAEAEQVLADLAAWTKVNGEAIFATRPWTVHGEGPALTAAGRGIKRATDYTAADIRFTRSKDGSTLYAIALGWPAGGRLQVRSLAKAAGPIRDVRLLGHAGALAWTQGDDGLEVTLPAQKPCETAFALRIAGPDLKPAPTASAPARDPIRAFCVDFNWGPGGRNGFAPPGLWADADPAAHVAWYAALGANVIQTFAVSCNGHAWYKGGAIPAQPGLKHDFLPEVVRLGHAKGLRVMGYFCVGANTRWGAEHPDLSYGTPGAVHIPFTDAYLDYLGGAIGEALAKSGMDGFMVDWVWNPSDKLRNGRWLPAETQLFEQLCGRPFPGEDKLTPEAKLDYERRALDRCWARIRAVAKKAKPDCVIWLSCNKVADPALAGSRMLREVDWMMDESGTPEALRSVLPMLGPHTRPVLCVVGWGDRHDARAVVADATNARFGIYGFAKPGPGSLPLPVERYLAEPPEVFTGNDRNIAVLARFFNDRPLPPPAAAGAVRIPGGGTVRASTEWGRGFEAAKACDGDEATRWGAAPGSRSGWLEIDLGAEKDIGRAVVMEIGFPRAEAFAIEARTGNAWKPLITGTTIAGRRTWDFPPVKARLFRLNIAAANEVPTIEEFRLLPPVVP